MSPTSPSLEELGDALRLACTCQSMRCINQGRVAVLSMPRDWVLEHIEPVANRVLDLNDYWEYLRLLEVAESLDAGLVRRLIAVGLASSDPEVREAATDFS